MFFRHLYTYPVQPMNSFDAFSRATFWHSDKMSRVKIEIVQLKKVERYLFGQNKLEIPEEL